MLHSVRSVKVAAKLPSQRQIYPKLYLSQLVLVPPSQVFWCSCPSWFSTSLFWLFLPAITQFLSTMSSPGQYRVLAVRGLSSSWVGSSSCCWRCPTAPGRSASLTRTAVASGLEVMVHFICPSCKGEGAEK